MSKADKRPFFPEVKQVQQNPGAWIIPKQGLAIYAGANAMQAAKLMKEALAESYHWDIQLVEDECERILLSCSGVDKQQHQLLDVPQEAEGYACSVNEQGMLIQANAYRGFLYGWFAMEQWLKAMSEEKEGQLTLPYVTCRDWPDVAVRGHHFDFKGSVPLMFYVKETIQRLARLKINTLLIEYEDQFPYANLPHVHKKNGYTSAEIRDMLDCAELYGMEVIPFIQSLGHVDYMLKHQEYAHLREAGLTFQLCPCHPGSLELVKKMIDEIVAWHPASRYIHIGADEAMALGRCERCQGWLRETASSRGIESFSKVDLFLDYVSQAAEYVVSKGKKPMLWDDMFHSEKCVYRLKELPEGTAICSWSYYDNGRSNWVWWAGNYYSSKQWLEKDPGAIPKLNWLEDLPDLEQDKIRAYWDAGEYPLYGTNNIPWIREYQELGVEVFGASCARGADHSNQWFANQNERIENVLFWAKYAKGSGLAGVISSAWTRFYSLSPSIEPWETGWLPQAAHACCAWQTSTSRNDFEALWTYLYAEGNPNLLKAIHRMEQGVNSHKSHYYFAAQQLLHQCEMKNPQMQRYVAFLKSAAKFSELVILLHIALREVEWVMYDLTNQPLVSDVIIQRGMNTLDGLLADVGKWEQHALEICSDWMLSSEAEEMVMSKLHPFKVRAQVVKKHRSAQLQMEAETLEMR
ncbi:family 20 glycosylhydrolase [Paenibacillus alba]|uniref:family 20 glycosylhydrolase n=1 Tax=Paenibacillus alba TaxID=1197127 RepID=UPI0015679A4B|nr:family 20 glycosylhydrolase [Paenibacillus alba]NQX68692.1 family 20 glycosylhydrolase [Paenibacillus alba]